MSRTVADAIGELPPLRDVIAANGLGADKTLGQHFLFDLNLTAKIARAAGDLTKCGVIEIGPGPGGLTRAILAAGCPWLMSFEKDDRFTAVLNEIDRKISEFPESGFTPIAGDGLKCGQHADLLHAIGWKGPVKVVSNLPYNVGTALILKWLEEPTKYAGITVLVQKEVAERLAAPPRSKAYGRLSVLAQWLCEVDLAFDIGPRAFTPPPQVTSTVVNLIPRPAPLVAADRAALEAVTKAAFGQRRKMLRVGLKTLGLDPMPLLAAAGIEPTARAEELDVAAFCRLAEAYAAGGPSLATSPAR